MASKAHNNGSISENEVDLEEKNMVELLNTNMDKIFLHLQPPSENVKIEWEKFLGTIKVNTTSPASNYSFITLLKTCQNYWQ